HACGCCERLRALPAESIPRRRARRPPRRGAQSRTGSRLKDTDGLMRRRAVFIAFLCLLLAACGGKKHATTTVPAGTTTGQGAHVLRLYFLKGNALTPVSVSVPETPAIATAALQKLLAGAPNGMRSAIPDGTQLQSVAISGGRATVRFSTD